MLREVCFYRADVIQPSEQNQACPTPTSMFSLPHLTLIDTSYSFKKLHLLRRTFSTIIDLPIEKASWHVPTDNQSFSSSSVTLRLFCLTNRLNFPQNPNLFGRQFQIAVHASRTTIPF